MSDDDIFHAFLWCLFGLFCVIAGIGIWAVASDKSREVCEQSGGYYYKPYKSSAICLKSSDVIIIKENQQ